MCVYIYIYRERERDSDIDIDIGRFCRQGAGRERRRHGGVEAGLSSSVL